MVASRAKPPLRENVQTSWRNCLLVITGRGEEATNLGLDGSFATALNCPVYYEVASQPSSWHPFAGWGKYGEQLVASKKVLTFFEVPEETPEQQSQANAKKTQMCPLRKATVAARVHEILGLSRSRRSIIDLLHTLRWRRDVGDAEVWRTLFNM